MIEIATKIMAVGSTTGLAVCAQIDPMTTGRDLSAMGTSAILGVVAVVSVLALVRLYRDKEKSAEAHSEKLGKIIEASTAAINTNIETQRQIMVIMIEIKDAIKGCLKNQAH
jgi:hypothetical protein